MGRSVRQAGTTTPVLAAVLAAVLGLGAILAGDPGPSPATAASAGVASSFVPVVPFRLADTRLADCGCRRIDARTIEIDLAGRGALPGDLTAVAVTVTALATDGPGYVVAYPADEPRPVAATLNTRTDRNVSNSAIVPVGGGAVRLYSLTGGDLVVDVTGAFVPAATARAGRFRPTSPRRILDTRDDHGPLPADGELTVPLPAGVAPDASAVAVNVASVGASRRGYLAVRPAGTPRRTTAAATVDGSGQAVSTAAIVPVSPSGFVVRAHAGGHVVVDLVGWFTGPSAADSSEGLFVPVGPTRIHDTRTSRPRIWPGGTIEVPIEIDAAAVTTNVTMTRADRRGYVTAYPAGTHRPVAATVNAAFHDHTVANLAVTRTGPRGLAYYARPGADLVVDVTGYFTGAPATGDRPVPPNHPGRARVLIVGDSTLGGAVVHADSQEALVGFDGIVDAASCRRLMRPSCLSPTTGLVPNTAVEAILGTPGRLDVVVVKAGYNDWFSDFPVEFDAVVGAARAKGAHTIVWLTYNVDVVRPTARRAYEENNVDLRRLAAEPRYADVLLADWLAYSGGRPDWFYDGTHVGRAGAYAITDYVSRWVAAIEHRPCPRPWVAGQPPRDPCPVPDLIGPVPDPAGLY